MANQRILLFIFFVLFLATQSASAEEWKGRFIENKEEKYLIKELIYDEPIYLNSLSKDKANYSTPNHAAYSLYSAIKNYDYDQWFSSWSPEAQKAIKERNKQLNRDQNFWINIWKRAATDEDIRFIATARFQEYTMIAYEMVRENKVTLRSSSVFKQQPSGEWKAVQDLGSNPVFYKWTESLQ